VAVAVEVFRVIRAAMDFGEFCARWASVVVVLGVVDEVLPGEEAALGAARRQGLRHNRRDARAFAIEDLLLRRWTKCGGCRVARRILTSGRSRSVREPLDSYGSRCSAVSMTELRSRSVPILSFASAAASCGRQRLPVRPCPARTCRTGPRRRCRNNLSGCAPSCSCTKHRGYSPRLQAPTGDSAP